MHNFDHDRLWKDIIERFFHPFLKRALPELAYDADPNREPRFLDKEFRDLLQTPSLELHRSPYFADYLMEVPLKSGGDTWISLHIEIQGTGGKNLPLRMAHYHSMIFDHYMKEPVALVLLIDKRPKGENTFYESHRYGTHVIYRYNYLDITSLQEKELLQSDNPFDLALCAAQRVKLCRGDEQKKFACLRELTQLLFQKGWKLEERRDLLLFLSRIVSLEDDSLRENFVRDLKKMKGENTMAVVTFIEKHFMAEGLEKGRAEGKVEGIVTGKREEKLAIAYNLLNDGIPDSGICKYTGLSPEDVTELRKQRHLNSESP